MKKSYTLNLVKTASDDYIKDIKQAMIDKGIVSSTIPDNELDEAISNFEGGGPEWEGDYSEEGELPKPEGTLEITENGEYDVVDKARVNVSVAGSGGGDIKSYTFATNGVYDKLYSTEEFTINRNDTYDFSVVVNETTIQFRKLSVFSVPEYPDLINSNPEYKFYMNAIVSGQTVTDQLSFGALKYAFYTDLGIGAFDNSDLSGMGLILMPFVKDSTKINEMLNTDKFEDNSVYVSDYFYVMLEQLAGASFDDVSVTIYSPGKKLIDGVFPVTVDVALKVQDSVTFTANGTYTPSNGYEGFKQVIVDNRDFAQHVFNGGISKYIQLDSTTGEYLPFKVADYTKSVRTRAYGLAGSEYHTIDLTGVYPDIAKCFFKGCEAYEIIMPTTSTYMYIKEECFAEMPNIREFYTGIVDPVGGLTVCKDAFKNCTALEKWKTEGSVLTYDGTTENMIDGKPYMLINTFEGCTNLKTVIFDIPIKYARQVPTQYNAFPDNPELLIYFQDASIDLVKADSTYANLLDKVKPLSEYVEE